tara:strand:- start:1216 stop:2697 length:1482 start_codon:yes stop_codon:yes gene_type:complete
MSYYRFNEDDVFYNQVKTHPSCEFYIYSGSIFYNNEYSIEGTYEGHTVINSVVILPSGQTLELDGPVENDENITVEDDATLIIDEDIAIDQNPIRHMPSGHISLYEMNIDRDAKTGANLTKLKRIGLDQSTNMIYPFITKDGSFSSFDTITTKEFNEDFQYGEELSGSYPLTASISRVFYSEGPAKESNPEEPSKQITIVLADPEKKQKALKQITDAPALIKPRILALKNTLNHYTYLSKHYKFSSSGEWDKGYQELNLISIPSIFYGSSIKKGTVDLKFYYTGSMIGQLKDEKQNGELIQVGPSGSAGTGSVAGVVLYNEGFIVLTGSWNISGSRNDGYDSAQYRGSGYASYPSRWKYFGAAMSQEIDTAVPSSSFSLAFSGTNHTPTITMLAHAKRGFLNWSNNPTYIKFREPTGSVTGSTSYREHEFADIKNTISSSYECGHTASFKKQTFINKVGIFDKDKNLIAIAKVSTPIRKLETDGYTFKLKLDI